MVSTFGRAIEEALRKGFKEDIDTYLLITGKFKLFRQKDVAFLTMDGNLLDKLIIDKF